MTISPCVGTRHIVRRRNLKRGLADERIGIVVVGMHRSGSSAITRVINLLGADISSDLMAPNANGNEAGYWESLPVFRLHEEFLKRHDLLWSSVTPVPSEVLASESARAFEDDLVAFLDKNFARSPVFVIKDPRISRLLPLWKSAFARHGATLRYVLCLRRPHDVAASFAERDDFPPAFSYAFWLSNFLDAEKFMRDEIKATVDFDDLLQDWRRVADMLALKLRLSWPRPPDRVADQINEFLKPSLRHHHSDRGSTPTGSAVVRLAMQCYKAARTGRDGLEPQSAVFERILAEFESSPDISRELIAALTIVHARTERSREAFIKSHRELGRRLSRFRRLTGVALLGRIRQGVNSLAGKSHIRGIE